ncbi:MAG: hypothetical protein USCAAHI_00288 [Beijerinckiaceae bacterium]|nr:MAG: hypothetical protein USCAAHI_00288 [Beijerinckiaceae bacterium]
MTKASAPFDVPLHLELFTQSEADQILRCRKGKRMELIRAGKLVVVDVAGKKLITGRSIRAYLSECAANPRPSGRSLSARQLNDWHARKARA